MGDNCHGVDLKKHCPKCRSIFRLLLMPTLSETICVSKKRRYICCAHSEALPRGLVSQSNSTWPGTPLHIVYRFVVSTSEKSETESVQGRNDLHQHSSDSSPKTKGPNCASIQFVANKAGVSFITGALAILFLAQFIGPLIFLCLYAPFKLLFTGDPPPSASLTGTSIALWILIGVWIMAVIFKKKKARTRPHHPHGPEF